MKATIATAALLVLALGLTSEAVQVEVSVSLGFERDWLVLDEAARPDNDMFCSFERQQLTFWFYSFRKTDCPSPWKRSAGFRSSLRAEPWRDNKAPAWRPAPTRCVRTPCCHRSSCPSVSREPRSRPSSDWVSLTVNLSSPPGRQRRGWAVFCLFQLPFPVTSVKSALLPPALDAKPRPRARGNSCNASSSCFLFHPSHNCFQENSSRCASCCDEAQTDAPKFGLHHLLHLIGCSFQAKKCPQKQQSDKEKFCKLLLFGIYFFEILSLSIVIRH